MSPSFKTRIKQIIKLIGIYSTIIVAIGGWVYVVADGYYGNKYKNIDMAKQVVELQKTDDKNIIEHSDIVKEVKNYSDTNFKNNREVINQLVENDKKNTNEHTIITNKISSLTTTTNDSNTRIIRIENILMNKKAIEGELGFNSE
jgi:hypothetical protein